MKQKADNKINMLGCCNLVARHAWGACVVRRGGASPLPSTSILKRKRFIRTARKVFSPYDYMTGKESIDFSFLGESFFHLVLWPPFPTQPVLETFWVATHPFRRHFRIPFWTPSLKNTKWLPVFLISSLWDGSFSHLCHPILQNKRVIIGFPPKAILLNLDAFVNSFHTLDFIT